MTYRVLMWWYIQDNKQVTGANAFRKMVRDVIGISVCNTDVLIQHLTNNLDRTSQTWKNAFKSPDVRFPIWKGKSVRNLNINSIDMKYVTIYLFFTFRVQSMMSPFFFLFL